MQQPTMNYHLLNFIQNKMKGLWVTGALTIMIALSCQKEEVFPKTGYEEVTLKNLTGFDCCGFVFQKSDSTCLEPTNLNQYLDTYIGGKKYLIKYKLEYKASCCMVGQMIAIIELVEKSK